MKERKKKKKRKQNKIKILLFTVIYMLFIGNDLFFKKDKKKGVPSYCWRLRIQRFHWSSSGHCCGVGLIPGLGTFTCPRPGQKKKKKRNKEKKNNHYNIPLGFWCFFQAYLELHSSIKNISSGKSFSSYKKSWFCTQNVIQKFFCSAHHPTTLKRSISIFPFLYL